MNRNEEYWALIAEMGAPPPALSGTVARARSRARKSRTGKWLGLPAASLGGVAAAFVLLVNCSMPFARACGNIPGLRDLAAAVALSPSLKAAVDNDFVQNVAQEQTINGITLKLEYLILDNMQINFFYTVEGGDYDSYHVYPTIRTPEGENFEGYGIISSMAVPGELSDFNVSFQQDFQVPEALRLICEVTGRKEAPPGQAAAPVASTEDEPAGGDLDVIAAFTFDLSLDARFTAPGETLPINRWVTVDGQRLLLRTLEVNPTHARLAVEFDPDNTAWLRGLELCLEDGRGRRYGAGNRAGTGGRLISSGSGEEGVIYYYLESSYFSHPEDLTLHITGVKWLDKDREWTRVDLNTLEASWLPAGVRIRSIDRRGSSVSFTVLGDNSEQIFFWDYRDPEGGQHRWESMGQIYYTDDHGDVDETVSETTFTLQDYPWDTVELQLRYSRVVALDRPVVIPIQ